MPAFRSTRALPLGVAVASLAVLASACATTSASGSSGSGSLNLVAYSTPQKVYATKDAKPRELKGGDLRLRLIMVRVKDHWVMDRIDIG